MRVLMISRSLKYQMYGGLSRHTYELCRALGELGCHITLACMDTRDGVPTGVGKVIPVHSVPIAGLDVITFNANLLRNTNLQTIDMIHSQGHYGFVFALLKHRPLIVTAHGSVKLGVEFLPGYRNHPSQRIHAIAEKIAFTNADRVIVVSKVHAKVLQSEYGVGEQKMVFIPNGVDVEKFNPRIGDDFVREKYKITGPLLLCVARLGKARDRFVHRLFPVLKMIRSEISNVRLIIVGDGASRPYYEKLRADQGLTNSVIFAGALGDDQLPYFYNAADLFILPTIFGGEVSILEAMACAKVVLYVNRFRLGPVDYSGKTNPIATCNDNDLADQIISLLRDDRTTRRLGMAARKLVVENFSWTKVALKTLDVYNSLV